MSQFTKSNYARIPEDFYPTVDPRCIYAFLEHFQPSGPSIDVCAPTGSGIVDTLNNCGYSAHFDHDALNGQYSPGAYQWIITNPPYTRPLVDDIITHQIERVESSQVYGVAVLLRSYFDHAKSRTAMFRDCPLYAGQIRLLFRPLWKKKEPGDHGPIHNFVWHIWHRDVDYPRIWWSEGIESTQLGMGL